MRVKGGTALDRPWQVAWPLQVPRNTGRAALGRGTSAKPGGSRNEPRTCPIAPHAAQVSCGLARDGDPLGRRQRSALGAFGAVVNIALRNCHSERLNYVSMSTGLINSRAACEASPGPALRPAKVSRDLPQGLRSAAVSLANKGHLNQTSSLFGDFPRLKNVQVNCITSVRDAFAEARGWERTALSGCVLLRDCDDRPLRSRPNWLHP